jgi:hypothetical protein
MRELEARLREARLDLEDPAQQLGRIIDVTAPTRLERLFEPLLQRLDRAIVVTVDVHRTAPET